MDVRFYKDVTEEDVRRAFGDTVSESDTVIEYGKYKDVKTKDSLMNILCIIVCIPMMIFFVAGSVNSGDSKLMVQCILFSGIFLLGIILGIKKLAENMSPVYYICTNRAVATKNTAARKPKVYPVEDILCFIYNSEAHPQQIWMHKKNTVNSIVFLCYTEDARGVCAEYYNWHGIDYREAETLRRTK